MWRELENRVYKTRFIIQKNFKNLPSLKYSLTLPDRIRSERVRSEKRRPDKRERERVRSERERNRLREPALGHATQVAPGFISSSSFFFFLPSGFDFFFCWCYSVIYGLEIEFLRLDFRVVDAWKMMPHQTWFDHENRVLKTRFTVQNRVSQTRVTNYIYCFKINLLTK